MKTWRLTDWILVNYLKRQSRLCGRTALKKILINSQRWFKTQTKSYSRTASTWKILQVRQGLLWLKLLCFSQLKCGKTRKSLSKKLRSQKLTRTSKQKKQRGNSFLSTKVSWKKQFVRLFKQRQWRSSNKSSVMLRRVCLLKFRSDR